MSASVADLCDEHEGEIEVCELQFRDFGGRAAFSGPIRTVRCHEDNSRVRDVLSERGEAFQSFEVWSDVAQSILACEDISPKSAKNNLLRKFLT